MGRRAGEGDPARLASPASRSDDPAATSRELHGDALGRVLEACGIPAALGMGDADGTITARELPALDHGEQWSPLAEVIAEEASEKLEAEITFDFRGLWAHDIAGRASAYAKLVAGGMPAAEARRAVGL